MLADDVLYVTAEGLQQMKDELLSLKTVRREEVAAKLEIAIKQGDLKETPITTTPRRSKALSKRVFGNCPIW